MYFSDVPWPASAWLAVVDQERLDRISLANLDPSWPWRLAFFPDSTQIADSFHMVKPANERLGEVRQPDQ